MHNLFNVLIVNHELFLHICIVYLVQAYKLILIEYKYLNIHIELKF